MEHARLERTNPKGEAGVFRCVDCGEAGSLAAMAQSDCQSDEKTSQEQALLDAIEGAG